MLLSCRNLQLDSAIRGPVLAFAASRIYSKLICVFSGVEGQPVVCCDVSLFRCFYNDAIDPSVGLPVVKMSDEISAYRDISSRLPSTPSVSTIPLHTMLNMITLSPYKNVAVKFDYRSDISK